MDIYELFNNVLDEFSHPISFQHGAQKFAFNAAFEGDLLAEIRGANYNGAKRLVAYSAPVDAFLTDDGGEWRPVEGDFFEVAANGVVENFRVTRDFEGVRFANWRFRVPGTRVIFYGYRVDGNL